MSRGRNKKKSLLPKILLFVLVLIVAAVIFGMKSGNKKEETIWQEGSMLRVGDNQVDYREGMIYLNAVQ